MANTSAISREGEANKREKERLGGVGEWGRGEEEEEKKRQDVCHDDEDFPLAGRRRLRHAHAGWIG